ncbi:DegT/DnrJ/EryC1/StrS aminotransferase family protein [Caenispirillum bisanense]|uniref:DegT/DnrJ/EryC1/StrS family aminotransferase n=1 Tax=Caenispirillum bisanense TaxID=414052 RepID=UPI0031E07102
MSDPIAFIDLKAQQARLGDRVEKAIARVLDHGQYIMGPEVATLERQLSEFCGARHAITCANGTEALVMVLMAWGVGPGDAVFVPSFTFIATAEAVALVGATPVFVDVRPDTFNLDVASLGAAVAEARRLDLRPRVVIPVDLFGQPAEYDAIGDAAAHHDLLVLADAAQGFGGRLGNRAVGTFGHATATSFFPAKPLGCYGDGGAIFTDDDALADVLRSIRVHGKGDDKYDNVRVGLNARLDTLQAAILIEKLAIFADELDARQRVAARYTSALSDVARTPVLVDGAFSAWAQYTLIVDDRPSLMAACKAEGVPTQVYYPIPMHKQTGYAHLPAAPEGCPVSEKLAGRVVSLPMHPYLSEADQDRVIAAVRRAVAG